MELNLKQGYLAMFNILEQYYDSTKNEELGELLGSMNPALFVDSQSADSAMYFDWENIVDKVTIKKSMTSLEAFQAMILFLKFYQKEFGFKLGWILEELEKKSVFQEKWTSNIINILNCK